MPDEFETRLQECSEVAKEVLSSPHVYIDTETSELHTPRIVQIAVTDEDGNPLLNTLVRQRWNIPAAATAIHGISAEMTKSAPKWADVLPLLSNVIEGKRTIFYNADFDIRAVEYTSANANLLAPIFDKFCVMNLYAFFNGDFSSYWNDYRFVRLSRAAENFGYSHSNAHDALADCRATRAVLHGLAKPPYIPL